MLSKLFFKKAVLLSRWYCLPFEASSQREEAAVLFAMKIKIHFFSHYCLELSLICIKAIY